MSKFLFGNVDKDGQLENEQLDRELIDSLEKGEEYLGRVLGSSALVSDDKTASSQDNSSEYIQPDKSAVDFSGINELAEDESTTILPTIAPLQRIIQRPSSSSKDDDDDYDMDETTDTQPVKEPPKIPIPSGVSLEKKLTVDDLPRLFPSFKFNGLLKFTDLFQAKVDLVPKPERKFGKRGKIYNHNIKLLAEARDYGYLVERDDRNLFNADLSAGAIPWANLKTMTSVDEKKVVEVKQEPKEEVQFDNIDKETFKPLVLHNWEERILWEPEDKPAPLTLELNLGPKPPASNKELDAGTWDYIFDDDTKVDFNLPKLQDAVVPFRPTKPPAGQKNVLDRFNLSDDSFYEIPKNARSGRVRQTFGPAKLVHSLPAIKLLPQFFKVQLSIKELRSHHRPAIKFPLKTDIRFSKVKQNKKMKKMKGKDSSEYVRSVNDLTIKDTSKYVLWEYSEEYPPIMMNTGMGTLIHNYYRKREEKDTFVPQLEHGVAYPLEPMDPSPFLGFGDLPKGTFLQALYNNLFRAPIFKHDVPATDFLVIRRMYDGIVKYYLREIPNVYVVGQTYPLMEVPRPQSRKVTSTWKARMQAVAYRMLKNDPTKKHKMEKLMKRLPGFTEAQIRQRLREMIQFQRKADGNGWWKLKPGQKMPTEDEIRKLMSPEMACLYESMCVGEQWLRDAGYATSLDFQDENEDDDVKDSIDIEVQLAPWTITRNFLNATQGKGMLKLFGAGDPTGRGEAFSFIRASMKEMFFRAGESAEERIAVEARPKYYHRFSIAEQQQAYKEEIHRIWSAQLRALSSKEDLQDEDEEESLEGAFHDQRPNTDPTDNLDGRKEMYPSKASPMPMSPAISQGQYDAFSDAEPDDVSVTGSLSSRTSYRLSGKNKVRDEHRELVWKSEIITDPRVMNAYLRQRTLIEKADIAADAGLITEEEEKKRKKTRTREQLEKLKQNRRGKEKGDLLRLKAGDAGTPSDSQPQIRLKLMGVQAPPAITLKRKRSPSPPPAN